MQEISTPVSSRLFYRKMGTGPAVVLLHGFPESSSLWRNIWDELESHFTLVIPDMPGSGKSPLDKETSMDDFATCVYDILVHENIQKAVFAGHSMGGYIALAFAKRYPEKVAGLSLIHSSPLADDEEKKQTRRKAIELIQKGGKSAFITQMIPNLFATSYKQAHPVVIKEQTEQALLMSEDSLINFYKAMIGREDTSGMLDTAAFPLQWILGNDDNVIPYKKILSQCYRSDVNFVTFYDDCGHMSMIEQPEALVKDLNTFVDYSYTINMQ
jgi:pimeloyl-ACP methyl ester carboxylesterase